MRTRRPALPGFLLTFAHAVAFKGGGGTPEVPTPTPPPAPDMNGDMLRNYLATSNPGYYSEFERNRDRPNSGDTRNFSTWLTDHLNATPDDALWQDQAVSSWVKGGGMFTPPPPVFEEPPPPPAPDNVGGGSGSSGGGSGGGSVVPIDTGVSYTPGLPPPQQPTVQPTPPPASDKSSEVRDARREAMRRAGKRKGYLSTLLAGETGGYQGQGKTLLGQ